MSHQVGLSVPPSMELGSPAQPDLLTPTPFFLNTLDFFLHSTFYCLKGSCWFIYLLSSVSLIKHTRVSAGICQVNQGILGHRRYLERNICVRNQWVVQITYYRIYHAVSETQLSPETQMRKIIFREDNFRNKLSINIIHTALGRLTHSQSELEFGIYYSIHGLHYNTISHNNALNSLLLLWL